MKRTFQYFVFLVVTAMIFCCSSCDEPEKAESVSSYNNDVIAESQPTFAVTLYGKEFMLDAELLDLTDVAFSNPEELYEKLDCFPNLKKVDVTGCELSNDDLAAVQKKLGNVILVWNVDFFGYSIPSDIRYMDIIRETAIVNDSLSTTKQLRITYRDQNFVFPEGLFGDEVRSFYGVKFENFENIKYFQELVGLRLTLSMDGETVDVSLLKELGNLRSLTLECSMSNVEAVTEMTQLEKLWISYAHKAPENYDLVTEKLKTMDSFQYLWIDGQFIRGAIDRYN